MFATAVLEPAIYLREEKLAPRGVGWADYDTALNALETGLADGPWLVGDMFTAADVALGAVLSVALYNKRVTHRPLLEAYDRRLAARPAYKRALNAIWPPAPPS